MAYISFQPNDYFNTLLYTGNNTDNRAITGIGFAPDLCWFKLRNTAQQHELFDQVRGANKPISSNLTNAQTTETNKLKSFDSDGFTLGTSTSVNKVYNYVAWNWKANGAGSSNTDGSITSTVSASTTSGFSIVKYTGGGANATVGHGLGSVPAMIIVKRLTGSGYQWMIYNKSVGNDKYLNLDDTGSVSGSSANYWNNTDPTSSVFSIGVDTAISGSGAEHIAYCFAEKKGFSKFGSYTGNGNADGVFVYTGFKPAFVLFKETTQARDWIIYDNKRIGFNPTQSQLKANENESEATDTTAPIDLCSNGFKLRGTKTWINESGQTYIFMAFAEHPLVSSNGVPATAR